MESVNQKWGKKNRIQKPINARREAGPENIVGGYRIAENNIAVSGKLF